jgi:metabotropic X receptor
MYHVAGCIIFGSDQEVAGLMRAVRRCNATGEFTWIGSDGWSARDLVSIGNEPEVNYNHFEIKLFINLGGIPVKRQSLRLN